MGIKGPDSLVHFFNFDWDYHVLFRRRAHRLRHYSVQLQEVLHFVSPFFVAFLVTSSQCSWPTVCLFHLWKHETGSEDRPGCVVGGMDISVRQDHEVYGRVRGV